MVKVNGLIILTEEEDEARIKKIVHEAIQEYGLEAKEDKIIGIDELRLLFGAKNIDGKIEGFPTKHVIDKWCVRKKNPLPCIKGSPRTFIKQKALDWFIKEKDTYQH